MKALKKNYTPPQLTTYGSVEALTRETSTGNRLDADFPAGTLLSELTVS